MHLVRQAQLSARVVGAATAEVLEKCEARSAAELRVAMEGLCTACACSVVATYSGDVRSKQLLGTGPLMVLDDAELELWLRVLRVKLAAAAHASLWRLLAEAEVASRSSRGAPVQRAVDVAVTDARDVAPPADAASVRGRAECAIQAVVGADGEIDGARDLLQQLAAEARGALADAAGLEPSDAAIYAAVLTTAYFVDCAREMLQDGSVAFTKCVSFAAAALQAMLRGDNSSTWKSFFTDDERLQLNERIVHAVPELLGEQHPMLLSWQSLTGLGRKAPEAVPEEDWPDEAAVRSARIAEMQDSAPVPERVWAMRNAAGARLTAWHASRFCPRTLRTPALASAQGRWQ